MTVLSQDHNTSMCHPLNQAAARWLPSEWRTDHEMPTLTLMRWGLANGLSITPAAPSHPSQEQVLDMLQLLALRDPRTAMAFLTDPEQMEQGEMILAADLERLTCSLDAATLLLETLCASMVATKP